MDKRENLLRAMRRQQPEYVPYGLSLCESLEKLLKDKTGSDNFYEYFDLPYRHVDILPTRHPVDYSKYHPSLPDNAFIDEWGVGNIPGSTAHFTKMCHPMKDFTSPEEVYDYPFPDVLADYRWEGMDRKVKSIQASGLAAGYFALQIFEPAWYLRGLENLLADMLTDEEMAGACLDKMTDIKCRMAEKIAAAGVDFIVFGDDVGTQKELMMSPEMWRKWLKPGMKAAIKAAKAVNPELIAYYHSDGVIYDIIPDLIEIGVDVLNPIQPECMDPVKIKALYGDRLSFWGTIGTQTTMPFGTAGEVEEKVKEMVETVGRGGGFVCAPTHILEPEVPWENILAFVNAVKKYGRYNSD